MQSVPVLVAASLATLGCASTPRAPETGGERERAPAPVVRETPRPAGTTPVRASFAYLPGTASYVVTSIATIAELDSAASGTRAFRESARIVLTIEPANGYTLVTTAGSVEGTTAASVIQRFVDTLHAGSMDSAAEPRMPICGRDTVPPVHLVTLLPPVPLELREGLRWQRRHVYPICQGSVPVRVERTDSYTVTGRAPEIAGGVTLSRSSSFAYAGSGVEGQHNVRVAGSGSAQATLDLDASTGRLVSAVEESSSEIDITASGQTRRFSQRVVTKVNRP
ncbi:hypothetical protein BH23GEM1_BH23GEM1_05030 [soil metagenome]